ncbi:MAG: PAS domain S-box protein [Ardenticatenaceae bacterium]|nr:PAS domain S-box protein [Ardenticatenaceae bacterium]
MDKARILIVEDEKLVALSLQKKLQNLGYDVPIMTGYGEEAVQLVIKHQPDLVMMDIMLLGKMDGIMAAEAIRQHVDIPIIYLTAYSDEITLQRAKLTQPLGYLLKPFDDRTLQTAIQVSLYRHQMEKRLKESEAFFRVLFDMAPVGMIAATNDGRFLRVNQAFCDLVGYTAEELVGQHFTILAHPDDAALSNIFEIPTLPPDKTQVQTERRCVCKNGRIAHISLHMTCFYGDNEHMPFVIGQIVDITERVMSEAEKVALLTEQKQLIELNQKARHKAETMQAANMALSQSLDLNQVLETLLNFLSQLVPYDNAVVMLLAENGQLKVQAVRDNRPLPPTSEKQAKLIQPPPLVEQVVIQQKSLIIDDTQTQPNWEYRPSSVHVRSWLAVPLIAGNHTIGLYSLTKREAHAFHDEHRQWAEALSSQAAVAIQNAQLYADLQAQMAELQEIQAIAIQNEKMSALGRLVASLAHEINNPIQAMQGCLTLGMEKLALGDQKTADYYLQIVQTEIGRVARIVQNLRDFYRVTPEQMQPTDLESILDSVLQLAHKQLEHHGIVVSRSAHAKLPTLLANTDQLKQVFLNLILNAIDAMPEGGRLRIQTDSTVMPTTSRIPEMPAVYVALNNEGEPIDAAILPHLFEPFFTTKEDGSGLGLSISYSLVEAHGGQIAVSSDRQSGTTFTIWLPVVS